MRDTLQKIEGVKNVAVQFDKKQATVTYDPARLQPEDIAARLDEASQGRYKATLQK